MTTTVGIIEDLWRRYRAHDRIDVWFAPPGPQWISDSFMQRIAEQAEDRDTGSEQIRTVSESLYEMRSHEVARLRKP